MPWTDTTHDPYPSYVLIPKPNRSDCACMCPEWYYAFAHTPPALVSPMAKSNDRSSIETMSNPTPDIMGTALQSEQPNTKEVEDNRRANEAGVSGKAKKTPATNDAASGPS